MTALLARNYPAAQSKSHTAPCPRQATPAERKATKKRKEKNSKKINAIRCLVIDIAQEGPFKKNAEIKKTQK